jgi:hypothetical protein
VKEETHDLLPSADLSERTVPRRVEVDVQSLLVRIFEGLEIEWNCGIHATPGYPIHLVCKSVILGLTVRKRPVFHEI